MKVSLVDSTKNGSFGQKSLMFSNISMDASNIYTYIYMYIIIWLEDYCQQHMYRCINLGLDVCLYAAAL